MITSFHFVLFLEDNGVEWKSLLEEKLNKNFNWDETFKAALEKGEEDALEQVRITHTYNFQLNSMVM